MRTRLIIAVLLLPTLLLPTLLLPTLSLRAAEAVPKTVTPERIAGATPRSVVFILSDDHRYDALGFMHPFLETPHLDALAGEGVHFKNAFVTTRPARRPQPPFPTGPNPNPHPAWTNSTPVPPARGTFPQNCKGPANTPPFAGRGKSGGPRGGEGGRSRGAADY